MAYFKLARYYHLTSLPGVTSESTEIVEKTVVFALTWQATGGHNSTIRGQITRLAPSPVRSARIGPIIGEKAARPHESRLGAGCPVRYFLAVLASRNWPR